MNEADGNVESAFLFVIIIACVGGVGIIWIIDLALLLLPPLLAFVMIMSYGVGLLGIILLGFFYFTGGSIFALRKVSFKEFKNAITFLDMLCHGVTELGSVSKAHSPIDRIDPNALTVRSSTTGLLLKMDSSFAKKWAKTVEKEQPFWKLIIEIPMTTVLGFVQTGEFLLVIIIIASAIVSFIASTSASVALALIAGLIAVLLISILLVRIYRARQRKEVSDLDMRKQSCKGLQMVFELAEKQSSNKIRLYVLGDYKALSYTGNILMTSEDQELREAFLILGGE
ncbi:MAG: hypothetical protein P1Q69_12475 [Candidatus Thorarchaeota archaeon]|nr:hypothetical protein [Candidatus Thorarchaeota archaeon]